MQIIDLSQDIYEGMKVYPGHLKTVQFEHATHEETAPRFEGGFSFQTTGFILNYVGYQIPFMIACGFACLTFLVTRRLDPITQRAPERLAADEARPATGGASDK